MNHFPRNTGTALTLASAMLIVLVTVGAARALPSTDPTNAYGVDGTVRTMLQVGSRMWVGGRFTQIVSNTRAAPSEDSGVEVNLAAFSLSGAPLDIELDLGGRDSIVYDLALAPDGVTVYAAGSFRAHGAENLIAFNGLTGAKVRSYTTPLLYSVHDDGAKLWAGGRHLLKIDSSTQAQVAVTASTDDYARRSHVVDIVSAPQGGVFIACRCDALDGQEANAFARVRPNGAVDKEWQPARNDTSSVGWKVLVDGRTTYLSAGGSDYVQAVRSSTGKSIWKTDTNGQVQVAALFGDRLVIGGHWRMVQSYCQPRLAALDPATGYVDRTWTPAPNPVYQGVWALAATGDGSLWTGGEFTNMGVDWLRNGLACVYTNGDQTRPQPVSPNPWARSIGRLR